MPERQNPKIMGILKSTTPRTGRITEIQEMAGALSLAEEAVAAHAWAAFLFMMCIRDRDRITTAITLYSGTLPIIMRGAIPTSPYMFLMKAIPSRAALLR